MKGNSQTKRTREDYKAIFIVLSCWLSLFLSFFLLAGPLAFPIGVNIYQLANSSGYVNTSFTVIDVRYDSGDSDGLSFRCADGTIEADNSIQTCALIFGYSDVDSEEELKKMVPVGTTLAVKYNPNLTKTPIQGATPRVIINESNDAFKLLWRSTASYLAWALGSLGISASLVYFVARPRWKKLDERFSDSISE